MIGTARLRFVAENVACERNGRLVFSQLNFDVQPGECAELRGTNGSGKSSLLRLLAGLVPAASGHVTYNGDTEFRTALHFIAHQDAIKNAMTVAENMQFWCDVMGGTPLQTHFKPSDLTHCATCQRNCSPLANVEDSHSLACFSVTALFGYWTSR